MLLKEKVLLCDLHMTQWSARKYDADASREIEQLHEANDAARVTKKLVENSPEFKAIKNNQGTARRYHYKNTLPWDDKGLRILPVEKYFDYIAEMEKYKEQNNIFIKAFSGVYEDAKQEAKKRLGSLYNKQDFPAIEDLIKKFTLSYSFAPIADETDLRVNLSKDEIASLKKNIKKDIKDKIEGAKKDIVKRMIEVTENVYSKTKDKEATFRDSLIDNVKELRKYVPMLNIESDEDISSFNKKLKKICIEPKEIRGNLKVRKQVKKDAKKLLQSFNEYLNQ